MKNSIASVNDFHVFMERDLPNQIGYLRHIQYSLDKNIDVFVTVFNNKMRAKIFLQTVNDQWEANHLSEISKQNNFIVGINGGFYTRAFQPAGLFIQNGARIRPLVRSSLLTTCVRVNRNQKIYLEKNHNNCLNAYAAMQTGPLIIDQGEISSDIYPSLNNQVKLNSFFNENRRTILAETTDQQLIAMVTTPATLNQIANILKNYPESLGVKKIKNALDLDGGSSTGMYVRFTKQPFYFLEQRHVKTLIFFY